MQPFFHTLLKLKSRLEQAQQTSEPSSYVYTNKKVYKKVLPLALFANLALNRKMSIRKNINVFVLIKLNMN